MQKRLALPLFFVVLIALFVYWQIPDPATTTPVSKNADAVIATTSADDNPQPPDFVTGTENLPDSLEGTEIDGGFELDQQGNLIPSLRTRELFDYFLAVQGEEPLQQIIARLHAYIRHHLTAPADAQAISLLDDYLGYLTGLSEIPPPAVSSGKMDAATLKAHHASMAAFRDQHFDAATRQAFFAEEEALDRYTLARMTLLQDDSLSAAEQAERLSLLQQQLPDNLRQPIEQAAKLANLRSVTARLQDENGSAAELRQVRENLLGNEAADRLESLDAERAAWQQRMDSWLAERQRLLSQGGLSDADRDALIDRARAERFDEQEIVRVRALERIGSSK